MGRGLFQGIGWVPPWVGTCTHKFGARANKLVVHKTTEALSMRQWFPHIATWLWGLGPDTTFSMTPEAMVDLNAHKPPD